MKGNESNRLSRRATNPAPNNENPEGDPFEEYRKADRNELTKPLSTARRYRLNYEA